MPYRIKGTLKLPGGQPAAGVDIEFISRRNYSPLLMDLSSIIKTTSTGAYDITLEYGEYAVVVYWGCNQPSHIGKLFVFSDTVAGLDLQTLLQQADWQPATPEYIQQIQDWLAQSNASASQAVNSAASAKASETAAEADRAEVASNKTIVVNAQADVSTKAADVTTKAAQVATNTATVNEKTPLAVAAADTASQKAVDAAASDASARDAATRAENAALAMTGAILDGGQCDLSSGFYPQPLTVNGQKYSTVWYVQAGGTVGGITYDTGDKLQYTTANSGFYFRIDARDEVVSVNGKKGAVTLNAQEVGADAAGTAAALVDQHAQKDGAHPIGGVSGLAEVLADKASKEEVSNAIDAHKAESRAHTPQNVGADPAGTAAQLIQDSAAPFPDVWIPFNDSLRMFAGYGREVKVGDDVVARMVNFERSTTATYIDKSGVLRTAAINEPRFEKQGLLIEGQSTNLVPWSEDMTKWRQLNNPKTEKASGIYSKITPSRPYSGPYMGAGYTTLVIGRVYTLSFWAYADKNMSVEIGIEKESGGKVGTLTAAPTRYTITVTASQTDATISAYGTDPSNTPFYIGGVQLEELPFASSYIPTNGAAVTRAADKCWIARLLNMQSSLPAGLSVALTFNKTGFTAELSNYVVSLVDIGSDDRYGISTGATITPNYTFDGYGNAFSGQLTTAGGEATLVMSLGEDGARACRVNNMFVNGTTGDTRRKVVTQGMIKFCERDGEGTRAWGHIRNFRIWHQALSDLQIKGLK